MQTTLLLVFALVGLTAAQSSLSTCSQLFGAVYSSDPCLALAKLTRCTIDVLAESPSAENSAQAATILSNSWAGSPDCDRSSLNVFAATIGSTGGNLEFKIGDGADVELNMFDMSTVSSDDLAASLTSLAGNQASIAQQVSTLAARGIAAIGSTLTSSVVTSQATAALGTISNDISTATSSASAWRSTFDGAFASIFNNNAQTTQPALAAEEIALASWQYNSLNTINAYRLALQLGLADDASDVASIAGEDQGIMTSASVAITNALQSFMTTEASRATAKATAIATELSNMQSTINNNLNSALASERSSTTARFSTATVSLGSKFQTQTGSNDYTACTADGAAFYSSAAGRVFLCLNNNQMMWTPIAWVGNSFIRAGSSIFTKTLFLADQQLTKMAGYSGYWVKCYDAVNQGWSSTTFHSNCNGKGATMTLSLSTGGRVFGGFVDQSWVSRNSYGWAGQTFLWRVTGSNYLLETLSYPSPPFSYATYDHVSYCPTFGYTSDYFNTGSCTNPSFSPAYYTNPSYSNSWLAGLSSVTLSKLEVFYKVQG